MLLTLKTEITFAEGVMKNAFNKIATTITYNGQEEISLKMEVTNTYCDLQNIDFRRSKQHAL